LSKIVKSAKHTELTTSLLNKTIIVGVLVLISLLLIVITYTEKVLAASIIFRLDDVQDFFASNGTRAVMDLFEQKQVPLTLGVIAGNIGRDVNVVNTSNTGLKSGLFELALHGLNHTDYTQLTPNAQSVSITKGNTILKQVFGLHPFIFVPPFNLYNMATLAALRSHDMNIISSTIGTEQHQKTDANIYNGTEPCGTTEAGTICTNPIRLSAGNDFRIITDANISQQSNQQIGKEIADNVKHYGYSIVILHPQDFVITNKTTGHVLRNQIDPKQLSQLSTLIDQVKKSYIPTSMSTFTKAMKPGTANFEITATKPKVAILTLDDDWIGQITNGLPILKKYGFNATFFVTCKGPIAQAPDFNRIDYVNDKIAQSKDISTWSNLRLLKSEGFDIQNHGMTHHSLVDQPKSILQREIVDSKVCLDSHLGIKSKVFAPAFAKPENNSTVDNLISKHYEFARNGYGDGKYDSHRFNLPTNSMNSLDKKYGHDTQNIVSAFASEMKNSELPVLVYHNIANLQDTETNWHNSTTTPETFDAEMKWLKDNGYQVHSIGDLKWDNGRFRF
jgi:peptidoglycan/xylan/chitin deacetylase (PgdA/CDA1 family)